MSEQKKSEKQKERKFLPVETNFISN